MIFLIVTLQARWESSGIALLVCWMASTVVNVLFPSVWCLTSPGDRSACQLGGQALHCNIDSLLALHSMCSKQVGHQPVNGQ
jgi:hypothetical protein